MFPENRRKAIKVRFPETVKGCKPLKGSIPKGLHPECSFHSRVPRRSFRSKDRSLVLGNFPGPVRHGRAAERKEEKRKAERPMGERRTGLERLVRADRRAGEQKQAGIGDRSLGASPWLRSVAGYGQLFFTLRANDRYVFSLQGWTYPFVGPLPSSFRAPAASAFLPAPATSKPRTRSSRTRVFYAFSLSFPPRPLFFASPTFSHNSRSRARSRVPRRSSVSITP